MMKIRRLMSLALVLSMVLAIAAVPGITASATEARYSDLTMEDWHVLAGEQIFTYPQTGKGDTAMSDTYTGWSSSWNGSNFMSGTANINSYYNCYQVYGAAGSKDTLKMPGYGAGKDFVILEFMHSRSTSDLTHDFAVKDIDGKIIETGYVRRGSSDDGFRSGKTTSFTENLPVPADSATTGMTNPVRISTGYDTGTRVIFVNNDDNTYSVIYYLANGSRGTGTESQVGESAYHQTYQLSWNSSQWEKMYTATYEGQFNGIGSIDYAVPSTASTYNNHRVNFLRIYTGNVTTHDYTVTISGTDNDTTYTVNAVRAADIPAPHYDGYVLKTRTAGDSKVNSSKSYTLKLEYAPNEESLGTWAIRNNVAGTTAFNQLKMLGSHDSFTDKMVGSSNYADSAGVLYGDSGSSAASWFPSVALPTSKSQSSDALTQLNAGVRYFDVRLSRMTDGTLWTRHGLLSEDFEGIAYTIAQFAKENPGEVIVLDFQSTYDAMYTANRVVSGGNNGGSKGDDNVDVYGAIWELLQRTGVADYVVGNISPTTNYNALTNNGTKTAIVCFAKARGASCNAKFISRGNINGVYTSDSSYENVVSYINNGYKGTNSAYQIIHAFTTGSNLVNNANTNNPKFIGEDNFEDWMKNSNIIILDNVTSDAGDYLAKLSEYTRDGFDKTYTATVEGVKVEGNTASVPFSTKLEAVKNGKDYTFTLTQFSNTASDVTGEVTLTFPGATGGIKGLKTVVYCDGEKIGEAESGDVAVKVTSLKGTFTVTTEAVNGEPDAKLGTYNGDLTIDYLLGDVISKITGADSFKVTVTDEKNNEVASGTLTSDTNVIFKPADSNVIYTVTLEAVKNGASYAAASISASLYSEVVENLVALSNTYADGTDSEMIAKANEVITHGGVYFADNGLTEETKKIITVTPAGDKYTITVNAPYSTFGIGFVLTDGGTICIGTKDRTVENGGTYTSLTVDKEADTITLQGEAGAVVLSLEAVNIEFIETVIAESGADGGSAELDFIPEL